ncbi:tetratricopeptide repeat protein [Lutibacter sp.]|uniref:tetratricopeptide repeat protein n=1 Tax=Lutibacter sp. TaxID=1925666 RepID=UPI00356AA4C9
MPKKKLFLTLLTTLLISLLLYFVFNNFKKETTIIAQSIDLQHKAKKEKINLRLENALDLINSDNKKAIEIAKSCLSESQQLENKSLEMRSLFVLGKLNVNSENIHNTQLYFDKALLLSIELEDNWYRGEILYAKGKNQYRLTNTKQALETFNEALYYCQLSKNYKTIGATYSMIGTIFRVNGVYSRAIEYFIKSRLNYSKANYSEGDAWASYLLGQIHADLRNSEKAMHYFQESLNKYQILAAADGITDGIAICYEQIAKLNLELGNFDEANKYITMLLEIRTKNKSVYGVTNVYSLLGKLEYLKGNYLLAETHLNNSLDIKNGVLSLHSKPSVYMYLGLCAIKTGNFEKGIEELNEGLVIALSNNFKKNELEIYSKLAEIYSNTNNFKEAIFYKNQQIELQDLILYGEADVQIEQLQAFHELDEKNRQKRE